MNRLFKALLTTPLLLGLVNCGSSGTDWGDIEAYKQARELSSTHVLSENKLEIIIQNDDNYLKDVTKDNMILFPKGSSSPSGKKEITAEDIQKVAIDAYDLNIGDKDIKVTLSEVDALGYVILFNKKITADNKFAFAGASLYGTMETSSPYIETVKGDYVYGDVDPVFEIKAHCLNAADLELVSFWGAFANLELKECAYADSVLTIKTSGQVLAEEEGTVTVHNGFFEEALGDLDIHFQVKPLCAYIDNSSFALENNVFHFDIVFSSVPRQVFNKDSFTIANHEILSVESADHSGLAYRVGIPFDGTLDEIIGDLNNTPIYFTEDAACIMENYFDVNYPTFDVYPVLVGKELTLQFRYFDVMTSGVKSEQVSVESDDLTDGCSVKDFIQLDNGFDLVIETANELEKAAGTIQIGDGAFKTSWNAAYPSPTLSFDVEANSQDQESKFDEAYCDKVIATKPAIDTISNILNFAGYAAQLGISIQTGNAFATIASMLSLMQFFGFTGNSGDPTIQTVLSKLADISDQLKTIDRKIDALKQQITDARVASEIGINKVLFNQYRSFWDGFSEQYIQKMNDILRDYSTDLHNYYVAFVRDTEDVTLKLKYFENDGKLALSVENPNDPGYTLEGKKITTTKEVKITKSHFEKAAELSRQTQGYSKDFDKTFRECLKANLTADNPSMDEKDLETLNADVYAHIAGLAQLASVTKDRAVEMRDLFINFSNQLCGIGVTGSRLEDYFKMMECLYNFQSEATQNIKQFRTNIKLYLDKFAGFATSMALFCPGIDKTEITTAYNQAFEIVKTKDNIRKVGPNLNYCYPTNSKIGANWVTCSFHGGFTKGSDGGRFTYDFYFCYYWRWGRVDCYDNNKIFSTTDLNIIYARALNAARASGKVVEAIDFYKYLCSNNIITESMRKSFDTREVFTSFNGIGALSSTDFNVVATDFWNGGSYFTINNEYKYRGSHSEDCWSGMEASGTIYNLDTHAETDQHLLRLARYEESHWYWFYDEHWTFEERYSSEGRTAYMFFKY